MEGGFPFGMFGDPGDMQKHLQDMAEQMQAAQKVGWADNAINLAVQMTVACINRLDLRASPRSRPRRCATRSACSSPRPSCSCARRARVSPRSEAGGRARCRALGLEHEPPAVPGPPRRRRRPRAVAPDRLLPRILVIPHLIVLAFYGIAAYVAVIIAWFAALITGRVPVGMHGFIAGYVRYNTRVIAYLVILADPYPPFGDSGTYPVDLEVDPPAAQGRLGVFFAPAAGAPVPVALERPAVPAYFIAIGSCSSRSSPAGPGGASDWASGACASRPDECLRAARQSALPGVRRRYRRLAARQLALPPVP